MQKGMCQGGGLFIPCSLVTCAPRCWQDPSLLPHMAPLCPPQKPKMHRASPAREIKPQCPVSAFP